MRSKMIWSDQRVMTWMEQAYWRVTRNTPLRSLVTLIGAHSFILGSCTGPGTEPAGAGQLFMPLKTGQFLIYAVTEQRYSLTSAPTSLTYQLKEVVGDSYSDVTGQTAYRLLRFRRPNETATWTADSLWSARLTGGAAIRTENGADFVKLPVPVQERDRWNGNRFNAHGEQLYQARQVGQPYVVNNQSFAETVQVIQQDDSTLLSRDKRLEVYARQVGLVYKERVQWQYCATGSCVGKAQIDYGFRQTYRLISYGNE